MNKKDSREFPIALWSLAAGAFAIGTTEFVVVGLLPTIAKDLHTSISNTGLLVTLYALSVAFGGPVFTALTNGFSRKKTILASMLVFVVGHIISAIAPSFFVLILGRILSGFAHGVFFGVASYVAGTLVSQEKKASAMALMLSGLTIAIITGVPLGTYVGQHLGWRAVFGGVGLSGLLAFIFIFILLPSNIQHNSESKLLDQLRILKDKSLLLVYAITFFAFAGTFSALTYLSPLLNEITGFSPDAISLLLVMYGVAIAIGNILGGKMSNINPPKALVKMFVLHSISLLMLWYFISFQAATIATLFLLGLLALSNVPATQIFAMKLANANTPGTEGVASAFNISAINFGIASGAFIGGLVVDSSFTIRATPLVGGVLVVIALLLSIQGLRRYNRGNTKL